MLNKKRKTDYTLPTFILVASFFVGFVYGWVSNIIDLFLTDDLLTGAAIVRIIGVFLAPLGAVMGYL